MKSLHLSWRMLPLCALLSLFVLSCQKTNNPSTPSSRQQTDALLMSATNTVVEAGNLEGQDVEDIAGPDSVPDCRVVTFDTSRTVYPHVKTIDFGTGCTGPDGITRSGKKIITYYANPDTAPIGTQFSLTTYDSFYVSGVNVTGTIKSYIDSLSTAGTPVIKNVAEKTLAASNGDSKTVNSTNYWKKIEGANTMIHSDDVFEITGSGYGNETLDGATEIEWTAQVDSAHHVIKPASCYWRTQGALDIQLHIITGGDANFTEYLDYGDGTCDDKATLSINGGTAQEVTLPLFFWPLSL